MKIDHDKLGLALFWVCTMALLAIILSGCGGGSSGPVTVECTIQGACTLDVTNNTTINGNVTIPGGAASAPSASSPAPGASAPSPGASAPTPTPPPAVPLAVPQTDTNPYFEVCAGCLQWSAGGIHYAVVFRDVPGVAQVAVVAQCTLADCTPGPNVWGMNAFLDSNIDMQLSNNDPTVPTIPDQTNASLTKMAKDRIWSALVTWFQANSGNLANDFKVQPTSTLPVPETGTAFARLTAIFDEHVLIGSDLTVSWRP
jgi:hypothetical protein